MKLNYIKSLALCLVLPLALCATAFASPVPDNLVVENLNGQQRMVKTYVLPPSADPETLKEPAFDYDGFPTPGPTPPRRSTPFWRPGL